MMKKQSKFRRLCTQTLAAALVAGSLMGTVNVKANAINVTSNQENIEKINSSGFRIQKS
ncbi:hypothetical protein ACVRW4_06305 [Streptococcus phocae subsp. phocae]